MKILITLSSAAILSGCGMSDPNAMKPGKWQTTTEIESFEAPGMPAAAIEQMKSSAKGAAVDLCMTKEMVASPNAKTFAPTGSGCTASTFQIEDGKISGKMSCTAGTGKQDIVMDGTIGPELYTIRSTVTSSVPGVGDTKMVTKVVSKRISDC